MVWYVLIGAAVVLAALASLYGLHRFCLWLEERGWLYYLHKKPSSSAASCFVSMQQAIEPQIKHVLHVRDERVQVTEQGPGPNNPPGFNAPISE